VIGVLDLSGGLAVHAQGGARAHYGPVRALAGKSIAPGDANAIARWYLWTLGLQEMYIADLDALRGRPPQRALTRTLTAHGAKVWVDAAIASVPAAKAALDDGVARVVVGLETLPSFDVLCDICTAAGGQNVVFSLDLRRGEPIVARGAPHRGQTIDQLAAAALEAGVVGVIVLDLARAGMRRGIDVGLLRRVRSLTPGVELAVAGGVRGLSDLSSAAAAGCDAALVATALYDGRILASDIATAGKDSSSPPNPRP
jgi:phosphoribosylformimino-5-aminoimidazole carboxamide ribotide isomerase